MPVQPSRRQRRAHRDGTHHVASRSADLRLQEAVRSPPVRRPGRPCVVPTCWSGAADVDRAHRDHERVARRERREHRWGSVRAAVVTRSRHEDVRRRATAWLTALVQRIEPKWFTAPEVEREVGDAGCCTPPLVPVDPLRRRDHVTRLAAPTVVHDVERDDVPVGAAPAYPGVVPRRDSRDERPVTTPALAAFSGRRGDEADLRLDASLEVRARVRRCPNPRSRSSPTSRAPRPTACSYPVWYVHSCR